MALKNKVAIVTGGNSGIGQAIVLELARQGAAIVIDYVAHPEATTALEQQIAKLGDQSIGVDSGPLGKAVLVQARMAPHRVNVSHPHAVLAEPARCE